MRKLYAFAFVALAACGGGGGGGGGGGTVATPVISPAGGTFATKPNVTITCATSGAIIYYTTDGSTPLVTSPIYSTAIAITTTTTVKAYAAASGQTDSAVASATYTLQAGAPALSPTPATYATAQNVALSSATPGAAIHFTVDGTAPTASSPTYSTPIALALGASPTTTTVKALATATGFQDSTVTSGAYVIDATATPAATPTFNPGAGSYSAAQSVTIASTTSGVSLYYTTDGSAPTTASTLYAGPVAVASSLTLKAIAAGGGHSASPVGSAAYVINLPATATPTFSPAAGAVASGTSVTISTTTASAAIYYTTDGSTPTAASTHYTAPVPVTSAVTLKAIATAAGHADSAVATAAYTIATGGGTDFLTLCNGEVSKILSLETTCWNANPDYMNFLFGSSSCAASQKEITAGLVHYDAVQGQACAAAAAAFTCEQLGQALPAPAACLAALAGTVATNGNCYSDADCAAGFCTSTVATCPGKCQAFAGLGNACASDQECASGQTCDNTSAKCVTLATTAGAACPCGGALWCDTTGGAPGVCAAPLAAAASCAVSGSKCAVGLVCMTSSKTCKAWVGLNGTCTPSTTNNTECGFGYECSAATQKCVSFPKLNEACGPTNPGGQECIGSWCDTLATSPTCKALIADNGTCNIALAGADCASRSCNFTTAKCNAKAPTSCQMP